LPVLLPSTTTKKRQLAVLTNFCKQIERNAHFGLYTMLECRIGFHSVPDRARRTY
jgi:hypothetical protein